MFLYPFDFLNHKIKNNIKNISYLGISSTYSWLTSAVPVSRYNNVSDMFCLSNVKAKSGQFVHIIDNILSTVINVPVLINGGVTTNNCCKFVNNSVLAISCKRAGSVWKLSTMRENARQTLSTHFLSCWVRREANKDKDSCTYWNSSAVMLRQQFAVTDSALRWALIEKKSRYIKQADTPLWNKYLEHNTWIIIIKEYLYLFYPSDKLNLYFLDDNISHSSSGLYCFGHSKINLLNEQYCINRTAIYNWFVQLCFMLIHPIAKFSVFSLVKHGFSNK